MLAVRRGVNDSFYLSRRGDAFTPLALADTLRIDGVDTGIGPATNQPGVPPYRYHTPVDCNLQPVPALDVTGLLPLGTGAHTFTLEDTAGGIFGTTSLYLVRDCGIWLEQSPGAVTLRFLSHRVDVDGQPASLDVVTGRLSELKADGGFARACSAGHFSQTGVVLSRPDPPTGEADYYLASGTCHKPIGFGDSSLVPDPRAALGSAPACP